MALQLWMPLTGDLRNQGLGNATAELGTTIVHSWEEGKVGDKASKGHVIVRDSNLVNIFNSTNFSISFWCNISETTTVTSVAETYVISCGLGGTRTNLHIPIRANGGAMAFCFYSDDYTFLSSVSSRIGKWMHIACIYDNRKQIVYIDGEKIGERTTSGDLNIAANQPLHLYSAHTLLNDFRVYDHALSPMEVKQLSQGLVLHYPLSSNCTYTSLIDKTTTAYTIYNNHGVTASLTKQSESYLGASIYRLSMTPTSNTLVSFRTGLHSHGVYGWRQTFAASTKYVFWIYYRPVTHMDVRVGGTASNISGWTEIPPEYVGNGWYRVGQCRNGTVAEAKTDNIFTSFYSPTAEAGVPIEIDFACPTLIQGLTEIQPSINWDMGNIIYDTSGYCNNGTINGLLSNSSDTPKYKASTYMPKAALITHPRPVFGGTDQEWTCAMWVKLDTVNQSSIAMNSFNISNNIVHSANGTPLLYLNSGTNDYYNYGNKAVSAGVWTHVVFVFRNSDATKLIYLNGVEQTNKNGPNRTSTPYGISDTTIVGTNLAGYISDYRVYATALSADDVKSLYQNCATIDPDGTIRGQIRS